MFSWDAISKDFRTPEAIIIFYLYYLLPAYILLKERDRWILKIKWERRKGEFFVLAWGTAYLVIYMTDYITHSLIATPPRMSAVVEGAIAILCISEILKRIYKKMHPQNTRYELPTNISYENFPYGPTRLIKNDRKIEVFKN